MSDTNEEVAFTSGPRPGGDIHRSMIHRVMDHVRRHLADDLSLTRLADVAHFSPHHFHRVFKKETGETVSDFTRRSRLERAVQLMRGSPDRELSSIAAEVGFTTPSEFSRVFKAHYGCTPSSWDRRSRLGPDADPLAGRAATGGLAVTAAVVRRPAARLAYVRVGDPWRGDHLADGYQRLTSWLVERGVAPTDGTLVGLTWENEKSTPLDRLTYDLGVTVDQRIEPTGEIGVHELSPGPAVEVHCRSLHATAAAWEYLYGTWLPASPWEPADGPATKWFRSRPRRLDAAAWNVDCSIPLRSRWA